ncbi:hypothetical protein MLD38_029154 [Melastoma candidum]|nr:hypothetical protein MLD38_029154 [Melastoma candidum]
MLVAWPLYTEQKLNGAYLVEKVGVTMPINLAPDDFVSTERVSAMKEEATKAWHEEDGTSVAGLATFIKSVGRISRSSSNGDVIAAP